MTITSHATTMLVCTEYMCISAAKIFILVAKVKSQETLLSVVLSDVQPHHKAFFIETLLLFIQTDKRRAWVKCVFSGCTHSFCANQS